MADDINYLDRNEFNFEPSPEVVKALKDFDVNKLCFYTRLYDEGKKSIFSIALAEDYGVDESQVVLGYGAEDILKQAVHFFLTETPGRNTMLIPQYSWWYYQSIADEVDGRTLQYSVNEEEDGFAYDFEALRRSIEEHQPKVVLVASPNNPTGNGLTPDELDRLGQFTPTDTIILVDEAYASFVTDDVSYIARLVGRYPNMIFCRTLSKFYGLPGLRMGFAFVGRSEEMDKFCRYANKYLGYDRLAEDIAVAALHSEEHYRHVAAVMNDARRMYKEEIGRLPGFKVYRSVANFILIKYPPALKDALQRAFAQAHYKVKFMNEPGLEMHLRITLGRAKQNREVADVILKIAQAQ